jgi:gluconolactonase
MSTLRLLAFAFALAGCSFSFAAEPPPAPTPDEFRAMGLPDTVAPDARVTQLASGFTFTEGATTAPNGDVYFVDQPNNKILKWDVAAGALSTFLSPSGYANGQYFDARGNLIACADEKNELWSITPDGKHSVLISSYEGKPFDGPNDVWVRPDGGMYFTDPIYRRTWWDAAVTRPSQSVRAVYFFNPRDKGVKRVAEVTMPNGIVGTSDGKTLYVADINARKIWGYDIQADGSLTQARVICNFGSDGMTLDDQGNLYLSANVGGGPGGGKAKGSAPAPGAAPAIPQPAPIRGVTVVDTKTGKVKGFIPVPEQPANMCFGGKNRDVLYITARTGFYSIPTKVKGANPAK